MLSYDEQIKNLESTVGNETEKEHIRHLIATHLWQEAKTMPGIPHEYSLKWKWTKKDFNEFLSFIWENGMDARFSFGRYSQKIHTPKRYWFDHESGWYYFIDPTDIDEYGKATKTCMLINRAKIESYQFWQEDMLDERIVRCCVKR